MKPEWKDFLINAGAEFGEAGVESFGNPEREKRVATTGNILCDLSHRGLISVYGEDAQSFLQGQFSNDLRQVDAGHSQLNSYCTPKGRMLANFRLFLRGETYYLRMPREMVEPMLKRLHMYVLRSKVTLEDADDALVRFGYSGPEAAAELAEAAGQAPEQVDDVVESRGLTILRVAGPHPRFEIYGELEPAARLWERLNVRAAPVGAGPWALLDILAGIPTIYPQTSEAFVPQMANMHLIGGVSFKKGCYPGQEVVARMQYLGRLKRRMYRLHLETDTRPEPGTEIFGAGEEAVGRIVDAQPHPDGGIEALAVLQIEAAEGGALRVGAPQGPQARLGELPYPFETATA